MSKHVNQEKPSVLFFYATTVKMSSRTNKTAATATQAELFSSSQACSHFFWTFKGQLVAVSAGLSHNLMEADWLENPLGLGLTLWPCELSEGGQGNEGV